MSAPAPLRGASPLAAEALPPPASSPTARRQWSTPTHRRAGAPNLIIAAARQSSRLSERAQIVGWLALWLSVPAAVALILKGYYL